MPILQYICRVMVVINCLWFCCYSSDTLLSHVEQLLRAFILKISVCDAVLNNNPPGNVTDDYIKRSTLQTPTTLCLSLFLYIPKNLASSEAIALLYKYFTSYYFKEAGHPKIKTTYFTKTTKNSLLLTTRSVDFLE